MVAAAPAAALVAKTAAVTHFVAAVAVAAVPAAAVPAAAAWPVFGFL